MLTGSVNDIIDKYPEFNSKDMNIQLTMFRANAKPKVTSLYEAKVAYQNMFPEVRDLFPQVFCLLRLLLVCPVTSCECERSFFALRRLKTWTK